MSDQQPETVTSYMNPFYDSVFVTLNTPIPSKRVRYCIDEQSQTVRLHERESGKQFDATVRHLFKDDHSPSWPLEGPLFMSIGLVVPAKEFEDRDVDNMAKTIIDGFKGLAYQDDSQIVGLFVHKQKGREYGFYVGLRCVPKDDVGWYVPEHYSAEPYPGQVPNESKVETV